MLVRWGEHGNSKYSPLGRYLAELDPGTDSVRLTFGQIEGIIRASLPASALVHRSWWANQWEQNHSSQWMHVGWRARHVSLKDRVIVFGRA